VVIQLFVNVYFVILLNKNIDSGRQMYTNGGDEIKVGTLLLLKLKIKSYPFSLKLSYVLY